MTLWGAELERTFVALALGAARLVPVAWMVPAFGGPTLPAHLRLGLGFALAALALPQLLRDLPAAPPIFWVMLLAREVAVGVTLGFVTSTVFRAAEAAGRLTDTLRGATFAEVISPFSEARTSPLGQLNLMLAVVVFLEIGGIGHVAAAIARSYEALPPGTGALPSHPAALATLAIATSAKMIEASVALAAPALVALLLVDLVLGAIGRMAPQIPLYFVGMPAKALAGIGVVLIGLGALRTALVAGFEGWAPLLETAVAAWR